MGSVSNLNRIYWNSVRSLGDELDHLQLSMIQIFVGFSESDRRAVIVLEVEIHSERVLVDDLVVDQGLNEVGVGISRQGWERQANQSLRFFKGFGSIISDKDSFFKLVLAKANGQFLQIGHQTSIKIRDHILRVLYHTYMARVFLSWGAFRLLSFDENIAGTGVNVQIVLHACDCQGQREEVAHRDDAVGLFGGSEVQFMSEVMTLDVPQVVVDNVTGLMALMGSLLKLFWVRMVKWQRNVGLYCQAQNSCKEEQRHRVTFSSHCQSLTVEKYKKFIKVSNIKL